MSRLLEAEDEDEFYKTTYGGFNEVKHMLILQTRLCTVTIVPIHLFCFLFIISTKFYWIFNWQEMLLFKSWIAILILRIQIKPFYIK